MTGAWIQDAGAMGSAVDNAVTVVIMLFCFFVAIAATTRRAVHFPPRPRGRDPEVERPDKPKAPRDPGP